MSIKVSLITGNSNLFSTAGPGYKWRNHQHSHYWPFVWRMLQWPVFSPHKELVMLKVFPCHAFLVNGGNDNSVLQPTNCVSHCISINKCDGTKAILFGWIDAKYGTHHDVNIHQTHGLIALGRQHWLTLSTQDSDYCVQARSIPWLPMAWFLALPSHRQSSYFQSNISRFFTSQRQDSNSFAQFLVHVAV